ncbi:MAG: hypothetical protein BWY06_00211 [Candidatus Latescibacteria bacterium ADurb.Bin168]|nr:MAG: hypothetical protein BWY06_00211 [Candidatus Latescibacteria bacterium ADurb.Bin168]
MTSASARLRRAGMLLRDTVWKTRNVLDEMSEVRKVIKDLHLDPAITREFGLLLGQDKRALGGWSLTYGAFLSLYSTIRKTDLSDIQMIEFGSGVSTSILDRIAASCIQIRSLTTLEHDKDWLDATQQSIRCDKTQLLFRHILCVKEETRAEVFGSENPSELWSKVAAVVPADETKNTRLRNAFYDIEGLPISGNQPILMILDGPHGNGRSLAFPLFRDRTKLGDLVLIDDVDHYPFEGDLRTFFRVSELTGYKYRYSHKAWKLFRIEGVV